MICLPERGKGRHLRHCHLFPCSLFIPVSHVEPRCRGADERQWGVQRCSAADDPSHSATLGSEFTTVSYAPLPDLDPYSFRSDSRCNKITARRRSARAVAAGRNGPGTGFDPDLGLGFVCAFFTHHPLSNETSNSLDCLSGIRTSDGGRPWIGGREDLSGSHPTTTRKAGETD